METDQLARVSAVRENYHQANNLMYIHINMHGKEEIGSSLHLS
jgi:hypothetical protein